MPSLCARCSAGFARMSGDLQGTTHNNGMAGKGCATASGGGNFNGRGDAAPAPTPLPAGALHFVLHSEMRHNLKQDRALALHVSRPCLRVRLLEGFKLVGLLRKVLLQRINILHSMILSAVSQSKLQDARAAPASSPNPTAFCQVTCLRVDGAGGLACFSWHAV